MADQTITRAEMVALLKEGNADIRVQRAAAAMLERDKLAYEDLLLRNNGLRFTNSELRRQLQARSGSDG